MKATLGWTAVVICTLISSVWGVWGAIEGFHEGWFHKSLGLNVLWLGAYLLPAVAVAGFGIISPLYPRLGMILCALIGVLIAAWVLTGHFRVTSGDWPIPFCFTIAPIAFGLTFLYGSPCPKRVAIWVMAAIPALAIIACGSPMAWRVMHRTDDGNRGPRVIEGNGVSLEWAGEGPGWDREGCVDWHEARRRCEYLSGDGKTLADTPQGIWRLPTLSELVQSM